MARSDKGLRARPETTLFLMVSVDGKITSGDSDVLDPDKDWRRIVGVKEGISQYYALERQTDLHSLNTGRVMAKIGVNERTDEPKKMAASFIIIDNKPHLQESGLRYLSKCVRTLYLVTSNKDHPVHKVAGRLDNVIVLENNSHVDLEGVLETMRAEHGIERITIQSGGTLNAAFLRKRLIDHVSVIIAPLLVGGKDTSTLVDGESLHSLDDLLQIKALKLVSCDVLDHSYIHLKYDVINETIIDFHLPPPPRTAAVSE